MSKKDKVILFSALAVIVVGIIIIIVLGFMPRREKSFQYVDSTESVLQPLDTDKVLRENSEGILQSDNLDDAILEIQNEYEYTDCMELERYHDFNLNVDTVMVAFDEQVVYIIRCNTSGECYYATKGYDEYLEEVSEYDEYRP